MEPEAPHGGVVGRRVVAAEHQSQRLDLAHQVDRPVHRGHAMVGADEESHLVVVRRGRAQDLFELLLVPGELFVHERTLLTDLVQECVHGCHVHEREPDLALFEITLERLQIVLFRIAPVGHVVGYPDAAQVIEDVVTPIHPTRHEQVVLLTVIELVDSLERDVIELEIAGVAIEPLDQPADQVAHPTTIDQGTRQPAQQTQRLERGGRWRVVEERPMAMLTGHQPGEDRGDTGGREPKYGTQLAPVRQPLIHEPASLQDLPAQRVDEDDDRNLPGFVIGHRITHERLLLSLLDHGWNYRGSARA